MTNIFVIDDRPDDDPEVVARREKEWDELPEHIRQEIDRRVADAIARIKGQPQKTNK